MATIWKYATYEFYSNFMKLCHLYIRNTMDTCRPFDLWQLLPHLNVMSHTYFFFIWSSQCRPLDIRCYRLLCRCCKCPEDVRNRLKTSLIGHVALWFTINPKQSRGREIFTLSARCPFLDHSFFTFQAIPFYHPFTLGFQFRNRQCGTRPNKTSVTFSCRNPSASVSFRKLQFETSESLLLE